MYVNVLLYEMGSTFMISSFHFSLLQCETWKKFVCLYVNLIWYFMFTIIKAKYFILFLWIHGVEWEAKFKEEEEIVNSSPSSYLLFGVFTFLLISIFVLYWNIKCFFFSLYYYGLPTLPLILLLTIIPIFASLWFHTFE